MKLYKVSFVFLILASIFIVESSNFQHFRNSGLEFYEFRDFRDSNMEHLNFHDFCDFGVEF